MGESGYSPKFPTRPVPLARQAELIADIAKRSFEIYDARARYGTNQNRDGEAYKIFDIDVGLAEVLDWLRLIARIARHVGDDEVRAKLEAWAEKLETTGSDTGEAA